MWASFLNLFRSCCSDGIWPSSIQGAGGLVTRSLRRGACLSRHSLNILLKYSNCSSRSSDEDTMFRGSNKFLLIESFHIPDIFVARLIPIDAHICTGKRSIVVAYNTGRNDISGINAHWVVSNKNYDQSVFERS